MSIVLKFTLIIMLFYIIGIFVFAFIFKKILPNIKIWELNDLFGEIDEKPEDLLWVSIMWPAVLLLYIIAVIGEYVFEPSIDLLVKCFKKIYFKENEKNDKKNSI